MGVEEFNKKFGELLAAIPSWELPSVVTLITEHTETVLCGISRKRRKKRDRKNRLARKRRQAASGYVARSPERLSPKQAYKRYLKSDEWFSIRAVILERDGHKCVCCCRPAVSVHHRSYDPDVMAGKHHDLLCSMCRICHRAIHYDGERKLGMTRVDEKLSELKRNYASSQEVANANNC